MHVGCVPQAGAHDKGHVCQDGGWIATRASESRVRLVLQANLPPLRNDSDTCVVQRSAGVTLSMSKQRGRVGVRERRRSRCWLAQLSVARRIHLARVTGLVYIFTLCVLVAASSFGLT